MNPIPNQNAAPVAPNLNQLPQLRGVNPAILSQVSPALLNQLTGLQRSQLSQLQPHQIQQLSQLAQLQQLQQLNQLRNLNQNAKLNSQHQSSPGAPVPVTGLPVAPIVPANPPAYGTRNPPAGNSYSNNFNPYNRPTSAYNPNTPNGQQQQQGLIPVLGNIVRGAGRALGFPLDGGSGSSSSTTTDTTTTTSTPSPAQVRAGYIQQDPKPYERDHHRDGQFDREDEGRRVGVEYDTDDRRSPFREKYDKYRERAPDHRERGSYDPRESPPTPYPRERVSGWRPGVDYESNDVEDDGRTLRYRGGGFGSRSDSPGERGGDGRIRFRDPVGREISEKRLPVDRRPDDRWSDGRRRSSYDDFDDRPPRDQVPRRSYSLFA